MILQDDVNCCTVDLIRASFEESSRNTRYLLIMTEEYAGYNILMQTILKDRNDIIVIFGSSFPKDQEFTQVNIVVSNSEKVFFGYSQLRSQDNNDVNNL